MPYLPQDGTDTSPFYLPLDLPCQKLEGDSANAIFTEGGETTQFLENTPSRIYLPEQSYKALNRVPLGFLLS